MFSSSQDGKAAIRRVKLGGENGADAIVDGGLTGGEQVIVAGDGKPAPGRRRCVASPVPPPLSRS